MKYAKDKFDCKSAIAFAAVFLMMLLVWFKTGIYFETNDDKCITEILCGRMTGVPDVHTVYVSCILTLPLSLLYRAAPMVPWYGLTLILYQVFAYTAVLESIYSRCVRKAELALGTTLVALILLTNLYLLGCIQYTSTAALITAAGYFCLLVQTDRKKGWICFWLLQIMGGLLRMNAMLMMQPMGILITGGMLISRRGLSCRERLTAIGRVLLAPVAVFFVILAVDAMIYRGDGWKNYMKYLDAETVLFDYTGMPPYEEVQDILDKYQVSEIDYYAYASYMLLDWVLPPDCAEEVAAYVQEKNGARAIGEWCEELTQNIIEDSHWGLNRVLAVLWIAVVFLMIYGREISLLLSTLGLLAGKLFSWGFLIYRGRFPLRISMPLLAGEILLLLALLLRGGRDVVKHLDKSYSNEDGSRKAVSAGKRYLCFGLGVLLFLFYVTGVQTGRQQYYYVLNENNGQKIFMGGLRDISVYCEAHSDNRYILDAVSVGYYKGSALETDIYRDSNYIVAGNWFSNSPDFRRHNAEYLSGGEGFYFIIYDSGAGVGHPCISYLIQETGIQPELYDRITVSHGGSYLIYYFDEGLHIEGS